MDVERRSLKKKKGVKKEAKEAREEVARVASLLDCEAQGIIASFAKLNMKVSKLYEVLIIVPCAQLLVKTIYSSDEKSVSTRAVQ